MTHNALPWSHLTSFLWLDGNKCCDKKREIAVLLHNGLKQGASVLPAQSGAVGGICIHVVGPWENVSLECIVSHIGSHLENHLLTSPPHPSSSSLSPPLALHIHVVPKAHARARKRLHSQASFIPSKGRLYTQTGCACKICTFFPPETKKWTWFFHTRNNKIINLILSPSICFSHT